MSFASQTPIASRTELERESAEGCCLRKTWLHPRCQTAKTTDKLRVDEPGCFRGLCTATMWFEGFSSAVGLSGTEVTCPETEFQRVRPMTAEEPCSKPNSDVVWPTGGRAQLIDFCVWGSRVARSPRLGSWRLRHWALCRGKRQLAVEEDSPSQKALKPRCCVCEEVQKGVRLIRWKTRLSAPLYIVSGERLQILFKAVWGRLLPT